jgi:GAF domain-containing protein
MAIPLLEGAEAVGALDFQSDQPYAFALDDVAAGETLAEFLAIALLNARLYQEARRSRPEPPPG